MSPWAGSQLAELTTLSVSAMIDVRSFVRCQIWDPSSADLIPSKKEVLNPCRRLDLLAERRLLSGLQTSIPLEFGYYGEEEGLVFQGNERLFALIDAVDGSDLILRGRELFGAISLAWFDPWSGQLLSAVVVDLVSSANLIWSWRAEVGSFWQNAFLPAPQPLVMPKEPREDPFFATVSIKPQMELKFENQYDKVLKWLVEQYPRARFSKSHCGSPGVCRAAHGAIDALLHLYGGQGHDVIGPAAILKGAGGLNVALQSGEELQIKIDFSGDLAEQLEERHPFVSGNPYWVDQIIKLLAS
ncbi:hypothetical protein CO019_00605 [Candidatus Berkelbacteria bacterium CG_4_9_14_0_2_um_filter_42_30]|uniref:Inositol monophosphatase n=6 Tax=Candidatus Berkelbacteria TaxID=1618330 RepID=A0A2M7K1N4_9BACT|nr:MAG: hypothetical protein AUJ40_02185 [Candidatus Berkelbacteria bacterium CG1_02_42_45]PIP50949.1 MAG: hypothetical protein COX11_01300 [Candidatus Berkelbacteria bacterium CG23_combo_of_CG06-09_8_20_14_all_41_73]PIR27263.1 MAG: hypothetical protein COV40_01820 [Candidatus Berkelbacteria bacterium CG11_big_fil_rev_8_21_14_0_20_42_15]PIX30150.1 MAG: hypothetical protein COZ63_01270 [Candidatus Berkelbacteria bacterium CG_4_8_14_3_um_filter_42_13]PIZ27604.1 MAG: hypothetical protein COY45_015